MKIREITQAIETVAPLSLQEDFDNAGIQVGNEQDELRGILLCTDVTEPIVEEAIEKGRNLIISHHPLIFHPIKKIAGQTHIERIIALAIKNDISIYCAHTNMDSAPGGVNHVIAAKMGLTDVTFMDPKEGENGVNGIGVIGNCTPQKASDFLKKVKETFGVATLRFSGDTSKVIRRVALCGGAGGFLLNKAIELGADIFVTADLRYHEFMGHEDTIIIADIGHYESEHFTKEIFFDIITKKNPNFAVSFAQTEENQIKYI
ncbi:MAG: Nif3-like dinuclear metal center hexameric protein [Muribaculaceae bacterium]|nr:Nif3-like dinuclear metal center hexameric protein [Muribaculaceae bacterium]